MKALEGLWKLFETFYDKLKTYMFSYGLLWKGWKCSNNAFVVVVDVNGTMKCLGNVSVAQNESQRMYFASLHRCFAHKIN